MKKVINIFLFVLCFTVISCHDDDTISPSLTIIQTDLNLKAIGGEASIQIQATGEVKATSDVEWCQVTEVTTETVKLSVQETETIRAVLPRSSSQTVARPNRLLSSRKVPYSLIIKPSKYKAPIIRQQYYLSNCRVRFLYRSPSLKRIRAGYHSPIQRMAVAEALLSAPIIQGKHEAVM